MINFYPWYKLSFSGSKHCFIFLVSLLLAADLLAQPIIHSFSPASGPVGTTVAIRGTNFSADTSGNIVYFGAARATVLSATASDITVTVPSGASYQPITVTTNRLTSYSRQPFAVTATAPYSFSSTSFASRENFFSGNYPNFIASGDLDGDGKSDLVTLNLDGNTISIFRNTGGAGTLSLAPAVNYDAGAYPFGAALGDLNGDGKLDVSEKDLPALCWPKPSCSAIKPFWEPTCRQGDLIIAVFKNTSDSVGHISFAPQLDIRALHHADDIAIADLDGDGKPELITADFSSGSLSVWRNTSSGGTISFAAPISYTAGTNSVGVSAGDFDNDGKIDIAVVNYSSHTVSVFRNNSTTGNISFLEKQDYPTGQFPRAISLGDLDGDGKTDIIISCNEPSAVSVIRNTSTIGVTFICKPYRVSYRYATPGRFHCRP